MRKVRSIGAMAASLLLSVVFTVADSHTALGQELVWATRAGGTSLDIGSGAAVDDLGNIYVSGVFLGSATFGPGEANETTLVGSGSFDIFLAKYDSTGALIWVTRAGGSGTDLAVGVAIDDLGNNYLSGAFSGSATFGPGEVNETTIASSGGSQDIFVAKYDSTGALIWVKRASGPDSERSSHVAVDDLGNIYVSGQFSASVTFGPGEANETTLVSAGLIDVFVAKYDGTGALVWAKRAGGVNNDLGLGGAVDDLGNSFVAGRFRGSATFGPGEANETTLVSAGLIDVFVAKYDGAGALVWAKRAGGTNNDISFAVAVDGLGDSYVTGRFQGNATFGAGEVNETTLLSGGIFLARYDGIGALVWAKRAGGGVNAEQGTGVAVDDLGNSYVTGNFRGSATFGAGEVNETTLLGGGIFLAKYESTGALAWAVDTSGTGGGEGIGVAVDDLGDSYVAGFFSGSTIFGPGEANETTLASSGSLDIFVAKFQGDLNQPPVADAGPDQTVACTVVAGTPVTLDGLGSFDPDDDPLTYTWTGPFPEGGGTTGGVTPTATLGLGTSIITLVVNDGELDSGPDTVDITVAAQVVGLQPALAGLVPEGDEPPLPDKAFKAKRTLPLKLRLFCGAQALTDADVSPPVIVGLTPVGETPVDLETIDPDAGESNDSSLLFRFSDVNWIYNLNTESLSAGKVYEITIEMPDGLRYAALLAFK